MDLKTARRLKPGDRIVAIQTEPLHQEAGDVFVVHSNEQGGHIKAARWITFHRPGDRVLGNRGRSCYGIAKAFDHAPGVP